MDVSFVIPAYNASNIIRKAIDSIISQEESNLEYELIIVDDGSNDNLEDVIKNINNSKIKFLQKDNGGVASARNYGVKNALGDYIIFVDSDDYIASTLLVDIERYIKQKYDIIKWSASIANVNGEIIKKNESFSQKELSGEEGFNKLYGADPWLDCLWNYAIKKERMLEFPEGCYHEDFAVMPLIMLKCETMIILDKYEYFYVQTDSSIMRGNDSNKQRKKLEDILIHFDNLIKKANELDVSDTTKDNVGIFSANSLLVIVNDLEGENKDFFVKELKKRNIAKYIKVRNVKQLIKRILLAVQY